MMRRQKLPHVFRYVVQKIRLFIFTYYLHIHDSIALFIFIIMYCNQIYMLDTWCYVRKIIITLIQDRHHEFI